MLAIITELKSVDIQIKFAVPLTVNTDAGCIPDHMASLRGLLS